MLEYSFEAVVLRHPSEFDSSVTVCHEKAAWRGWLALIVNCLDTNELPTPKHQRNPRKSNRRMLSC